MHNLCFLQAGELAMRNLVCRLRVATLHVNWHLELAYII